MRTINLENGKYSVHNELDSGGGFYAKRGGEDWRSLAGDKLVLAMFHRIESLTERLNKAESLLGDASDLLDDVHCGETGTCIAIDEFLGEGE